MQSEEKMIPETQQTNHLGKSKDAVASKGVEHNILTTIRIIPCRKHEGIAYENKGCSIGKEIQLWKDKELDGELVNFLFLEEYVSSLKVLCVSF